ncbi:unnamed protein product [Gadus morhua 'NCC']
MGPPPLPRPVSEVLELKQTPPSELNQKDAPPTSQESFTQRAGFMTNAITNSCSGTEDDKGLPPPHAGHGETDLTLFIRQRKAMPLSLHCDREPRHVPFNQEDRNSRQ